MVFSAYTYAFAAVLAAALLLETVYESQYRKQVVFSRVVSRGLTCPELATHHGVCVLGFQMCDSEGVKTLQSMYGGPGPAAKGTIRVLVSWSIPANHRVEPV